MNQAILDNAVLFQALGYDIILVDSNKNPGIVKDWPTHVWNAAEFESWLTRRDDLSLAIRLGEYIDVEIDCEDETERAALETDLRPLTGSTVSWRSRRGRHWLFKLSIAQRQLLLDREAPNVVKVNKLEFRLGFKPAQSLIPTPGDDYRTWIETPGDCDVSNLPTILWQQLLTAVPEKEEPNNEYEPPTRQRPGDVFNERTTWHEIMVPAGWRVFNERGSVTQWTRPGKSTGLSATTGYCGTDNRPDCLYCFSDSEAISPFEPLKTYTKFEAWAWLNHEGNFAAAAAALLRSGYSPEVSGDCSEFDDIIPEREQSGQNAAIPGQPNTENVHIIPEREQKPDIPGHKHPRLDLSQFTDPLTKYCLALEQCSAADVGAIWFQLHEIFANFLGRNPHFIWSGKKYYINGNLFIIGPTATGKKGLSLSAAKAPFNSQIGGEFSDDIEFSTYEPLMAGGYQSGQAILTHFMKDKDDIGEKDKRLLMVEQESAALIKMGKVENSILSQVMRTAFDGDKLEYRVSKIKGKDSTVAVKDAHVSLIGHITGDELLQVLTVGSDKTGELNRIQFVLCLDSKFVPEARSNFLYENIPELQRLRGHILACGKWATDQRIQFTEPLHKLLDDYTEQQETNLRSGKEKPVNARLALYLRKWIARFAVLDMTNIATVTHYERAMSIISYIRAANEYVLGEWLDGVDKDLIDKVILTLGESQGGTTRAAIGRELYGNHWTVDKVEGVLAHARKRLALSGKIVKEKHDRNKIIYHL